MADAKTYALVGCLGIAGGLMLLAGAGLAGAWYILDTADAPVAVQADVDGTIEDVDPADADTDDASADPPDGVAAADASTDDAPAEEAAAEEAAPSVPSPPPVTRSTSGSASRPAAPSSTATRTTRPTAGAASRPSGDDLAPDPSRATVKTAGKAQVTLVGSGRRIALPANVPPGRYTVEATFPGASGATEVGNLSARAGKTYMVKCVDAMGVCHAVQMGL